MCDEFLLGLDECIDNIRVEMDAALFENDRFSDVMGKGVFVHAFRGERVVDVRQGHDPPAQRNLVPHEPLRISAAVVPLVVRERDIVGHAEEFRVGLIAGRRGQRVRTDADVRLHDLEFLVGERAPLEEHAVLDADFADVVQRAGQVNQVHKVGIDDIRKFLVS